MRVQFAHIKGEANWTTAVFKSMIYSTNYGLIGSRYVYYCLVLRPIY